MPMQTTQEAALGLSAYGESKLAVCREERGPTDLSAIVTLVSMVDGETSSIVAMLPVTLPTLAVAASTAIGFMRQAQGGHPLGCYLLAETVGMDIDIDAPQPERGELQRLLETDPTADIHQHLTCFVVDVDASFYSTVRMRYIYGDDGLPIIDDPEAIDLPADRDEVLSALIDAVRK